MKPLGWTSLLLLIAGAALVLARPWRPEAHLAAASPVEPARPGRSFHAARATEPGPVVLVVIDTLRADHLDAYGYALPTNAGLEAVLRRSTRFERCAAPASWTSPSTATILTGLTPFDHGVMEHGDRMPEGCQTLAEILGAAGWQTVGVSFNKNVSRKTRFGQGFQSFEDAQGRALDYPDVGEMVTSVRTWLDRRGDGPTLLYLQPMNCHGPYKVPVSYQARLLERAPSTEFVYAKGRMQQLMNRRELDSRDSVPASYVTSMTEQYDTAVRYCLDRVGEIFLDLDAAGLLDPALVVITADHGEELFDHGGFGHGYNLYEECLRVPLFVKLPGQRAPSSVEERVALLDLLPTILEHAGVQPDHPLPGESLLPLCGGAAPATELRARLSGRSLVASVEWPKRLQGEAIYSGDYKLISIRSSWQHPAPARLLFDLRQDPLERRDLAAAEPLVLHYLERALSIAARPSDPDAQRVTDNVRAAFRPEELEALGY